MVSLQRRGRHEEVKSTHYIQVYFASRNVYLFGGDKIKTTGKYKQNSNF
jgi:hypothetical protein